MKENKKNTIDAATPTVFNENPSAFANIPEEMKMYKAWLVHKEKTPYSPLYPYQKCNIGPDCGTFEQAIEALGTGNFDGIGFQFNNTPFTGIDLDHHIEDGEFDEFAMDIFKKLDSYTEYSPSGKGIHIYVKGKLPSCVKDSKNGIEIYSEKRFFTVTGNIVKGSSREIAERPSEIKELYRQYKKNEIINITSLSEYDYTPDSRTDEDLIELIIEKDRSGNFKTLFYDGNISSYGNDDSSADFALLNILAYWTNGEAERMERLFNQSPLANREKWKKRKDYRERTINKAINLFKTETITKAIKGAISGKNEGRIERKWFYTEKGRFLHDKFGKFLITFCHICRLQVNEQPQGGGLTGPLMFYNHESGVYMQFNLYADKIIRTLLSELKTNKVNEVKEYIKAMAPVKQIEQPQAIAVNNGILDPYTGELISKSPDVVTTCHIDVIYDPHYKNAPELSKFFKNLFGDDKEMINFIYEIMGYTLSPTNFMQKLFILWGTGGNGKSGFLYLLENIIGSTYVSKEKIYNIYSNRFRTAELQGKMINIDHDMESSAINQTADLKKIVTGDPISCERKGQNPFVLYPRVKLFIAANTLPKICDNSQGMQDRVLIIPFLRYIRGTTRDDFIISRIMESEEEKGVLFYNMVLGLQRLRKNRSFSIPPIVKEYTNNYFIDIDPVALFTKACEAGDVTYNGKTISIERESAMDVYHCFNRWCSENRYKIDIPNNVFGKEMKRLGYDNMQRRIDGKKIRLYVKK